MSKRKSPLHLASQKLIEIFEKSGRSITANASHQLLHAAIGTISPEKAGELGVPFHTLANHDITGTTIPNRHKAVERAMDVLKVDQWQAIRAVEDVIDVIRDSKIGVAQVRLLLDPKYEPVRKQVFSALLHSLKLNAVESLTPTTATLAIANGGLPLPDISLKGRFDMAANWPVHGPSELVRLVSENTCYLWQFPPTSHVQTSHASRDKYFTGGTHTAELGMGFAIIAEAWEREKNSMRPEEGTYQQYMLYTPFWACRAGATQWRLGNILRSSIRDGAYWSDVRLRDVLPGGLESLPRIHGCPTCRTLYIENRRGQQGAPTQCACQQDPAHPLELVRQAEALN